MVNLAFMVRFKKFSLVVSRHSLTEISPVMSSVAEMLYPSSSQHITRLIGSQLSTTAVPKPFVAFLRLRLDPDFFVLEALLQARTHSSAISLDIRAVGT